MSQTINPPIKRKKLVKFTMLITRKMQGQMYAVRVLEQSQNESIRISFNWSAYLRECIQKKINEQEGKK